LEKKNVKGSRGSRKSANTGRGGGTKTKVREKAEEKGAKKENEEKEEKKNREANTAPNQCGSPGKRKEGKGFSKKTQGIGGKKKIRPVL